ncbi:Gfo/Idh/MocA family protein [Kosmotoga pacifica]|uniref:Oxidoreductase n=1 Tax=Kosmotoga pacifica TaxID=1330330 RepID=A0A0G2Z4P0_9BACT|nr:Gfo/Idh/MocA family oxidoreductase [Kosmotoga pacifica]AKI96517.1 oxidoreductase [Kosmotoga pacifica]
MARLRAALIGCGRIGIKKHLEAFAVNSDKIELVAVCDIVKERAEKAAEEYKKRCGLYVVGCTEDQAVMNNVLKSAQPTTNNQRRISKPQVITDYSELLDKDIDFVTIATESGNHYKNTIDFLSAGKHVLVEKPMALSTRHMNEMISLAKEKELKLGVCFQNRFNPPIQELRKAIDSGAFGRIFNATARILWNRNEDYYKQASWRGTWAMDGGTLMNQCSHNIDLLQWVLGGEVEEIYAVTKNYNHKYIETEDFGVAIIKFKNGSVGIIEGTANVYPKNLEETLSVFGERGTVVIGGLAVNRIQTWLFDGVDGHPFMKLPDPETVYGYGHVTLFADFVDAIIENRDPYITGEEGRKAVEIILGIYKSAKEKQPVKFPIDFSTEDMMGIEL